MTRLLGAVRQAFEADRQPEAETSVPAEAAEKRAIAQPSSPNRFSRRRVVVLCLVAMAIAGASFLFHSEALQDWRLARLPLSELQSELQSGGENPNILYYIGTHLNEAKQFTAADGYLRQGVGLDPHSARLRGEWARALLGSGQTTAAFGELREFAGTHPRLAEAHYILGKFYYTEHSMMRAAEEFERTVALEPGHAEALLYLAGARDSLNNLNGAREAAARAVSLRPGDARARLVLACLMARTHEAPWQVRLAFETAIKLAPRQGAAHQEFARWLIDAASSPEDRALASEHARQAVALGVEDPAAYLVLGRAHMYSGDMAGAVDSLTRAAHLAPEDPAAALALSQALNALRDKAAAEMWRRNYLERQQRLTEKNKLLQDVTVAPSDPGRKALLAKWLGRHGDADECVHNYSMAMRMPLDSPTVLIAASHSLVEGGYAGLAVPLCRRAVESTRRSPDAHEALGDALLMLRQVNAAVTEYNTAARLDPRRAMRLIVRSRGFLAAHRNEPALRSARIVDRTTGPKQ